LSSKFSSTLSVMTFRSLYQFFSALMALLGFCWLRWPCWDNDQNPFPSRLKELWHYFLESPFSTFYTIFKFKIRLNSSELIYRFGPTNSAYYNSELILFRSQFHQHFMHAFFVQKQIEQLFSCYIQLCNFWRQIFFTKKRA